MADVFFSYAVHFLTADYPYASELQAFFQAYAGHLMVRRVHNNERQMNWFHAFMLGAVSSMGGGTFAPLLMGRPTFVLANELTVPILVVSYLLAYQTPFDIGYKFGNTLLFRIISTPFTSMFKTSGTVGFSTSAFYAFQDNESKLYSIPVVAPILYPTLLGNMGAFFVKGFNGHLKNGMPWAFQNGMCRSAG
jgi:Na+/H+ antiporter NhaD/arsenite permease-like protein